MEKALAGTKAGKMFGKTVAAGSGCWTKGEGVPGV